MTESVSHQYVGRGYDPDIVFKRYVSRLNSSDGKAVNLVLSEGFGFEPRTGRKILFTSYFAMCFTTK